MENTFHAFVYTYPKGDSKLDFAFTVSDPSQEFGQLRNILKSLHTDCQESELAVGAYFAFPYYASFFCFVRVMRLSHGGRDYMELRAIVVSTSIIDGVGLLRTLSAVDWDAIVSKSSGKLAIPDNPNFVWDRDLVSKLGTIRRAEMDFDAILEVQRAFNSLLTSIVDARETVLCDIKVAVGVPPRFLGDENFNWVIVQKPKPVAANQTSSKTPLPSGRLNDVLRILNEDARTIRAVGHLYDTINALIDDSEKIIPPTIPSGPIHLKRHERKLMESRMKRVDVYFARVRSSVVRVPESVKESEEIYHKWRNSFESALARPQPLLPPKTLQIAVGVIAALILSFFAIRGCQGSEKDKDLANPPISQGDSASSQVDQVSAAVTDLLSAAYRTERLKDASDKEHSKNSRALMACEALELYLRALARDAHLPAGDDVSLEELNKQLTDKGKYTSDSSDIGDSVEKWLKLRHLLIIGKYSQVSDDEVSDMLPGIQQFVNPSR